MGCSKSSSKREVYSNKILPQETRKDRIDNLTLHLKQLGKEKKKPKISRSKEIINIRAQINEKDRSARKKIIIAFAEQFR